MPVARAAVIFALSGASTRFPARSAGAETGGRKPGGGNRGGAEIGGAGKESFSRIAAGRPQPA